MNNGERTSFSEVERPEIGGMNPNTVAEIQRFVDPEPVAQAEMPADTPQMTKEEIYSTPVAQPSDSQEMMYADSMREMGVKSSTMVFNDKGQEKLSDEAIKAVEAAIEEVGDDMAALNTMVDDLGQTLVLNAYNRRRGEGLKVA